MISFNTNKDKIYNKIIHKYLERELFGNPMIDVGDRIENYFPKYLYREQYQRCFEVFEDLYEWTSDFFKHELTAFYEVGLYYFLCEMNNLKNDCQGHFKTIFYDKELQQEIKNYCKEEIKELNDDFTLLELEEFYYNPSYICDDIFDDVDFLEISYLYNEQEENLPIIAETLGINLDYYFEILPRDIQRKYQSQNITLTGEVNEFFNYLQKRIDYASLNELFWELEKPVKEKRIHTILENIMHAYFLGKSVDISREVLIKNGQVDFKLFRNHQKGEKVLIEVKKASSSYLKAGYEHQLIDYIKYSDCHNAFYLIICFTDNEYKKAVNFIKRNVYTDNYQMYINIKLLDVRKKVSPSKKTNTHS